MLTLQRDKFTCDTPEAYFRHLFNRIQDREGIFSLSEINSRRLAEYAPAMRELIGELFLSLTTEEQDIAVIYSAMIKSGIVR